MSDYNYVYPQLPQDGDHFRLQKSCEALESLKGVVKHYEDMRKKYNRTRGITHNISVVTGVLGVILSSTALGTSFTGIGIVVGVPIGAFGGLFGLVR